MGEVNKNNIGYILLVIACIVLSVYIVYTWIDNATKPKLRDQIEVQDTTYSRVTLDSIKVQIGKHDTTIYKLNLKLKEDVEKSYNLPDSDAVALFKKLLSDKPE